MPPRRRTLRTAAICLTLGAISAALLAWIPGSFRSGPFMAASAGAYRPLTSAESTDPGAGWAVTRTRTWERDIYESRMGFDGAMYVAFANPEWPTVKPRLLSRKPPDGDPLTFPPRWARSHLAHWLNEPLPWINQPNLIRGATIECRGLPFRMFFAPAHSQDTWEAAAMPLISEGRLHSPRWLTNLFPEPPEPPDIKLMRADPTVHIPKQDRGLHLPIYPIWTGLLANLAVLSAAWWLLLFAPFALRRTWRSRRGRCAKCGYDLRATPSGQPCPECGHLTRHPVSTQP